MKYLLVAVIAVLILSGFKVTSKSDEGKVLMPAIGTKYEGEVKKGLAHGDGKAWGESDFYVGKFRKGYPHGKGVYTWGNGNVYKGEFSKGKMSGQGELAIKRKALPDSVQVGYFKENKYIGKYKEPYRVTSEQGIRKVEFQKNAGNINQVSIMVYADGKELNSSLSIRDPKNTMIENIGGNMTLTNVVFPIKQVDVSFSTGQFSHSLTFEIFEEGNWLVIISV
ncbi:hypothetical protein [Marinifilum fragile]|uniref:hypothetical protein n=1 Tax=Marinifilum fragile TaxID=570161 RepID=UPI002AA69656|nr:hypothetical protein [Marinifilum fragile]